MRFITATACARIPASACNVKPAKNALQYRVQQPDVLDSDLLLKPIAAYSAMCRFFLLSLKTAILNMLGPGFEMTKSDINTEE